MFQRQRDRGDQTKEQKQPMATNGSLKQAKKKTSTQRLYRFVYLKIL